MNPRARFSSHLMIGIGLVVILGLGQLVLVVEYKEYKLGMTSPRSGDQTPIGDLQVGGVETAVKEINVKGGIDGVLIWVIIEDNQAKPILVVTALIKLISVDKVFLAFTIYSIAQLVQVFFADKSKVVMINVGASSVELINSGKYIFHIQPNSSSYLRVSTNYMCQVLGLKGKWAILYMNEAMGKSFNKYVTTLLPKYGVKDIFHDNYENGAVTDFRPIIAKAMNFGANVIFVGGFDMDSALCLKQMRDGGFNGPAMMAWGGGQYTRIAPTALHDTYYGEQVIPENKRIQGLKEELLNVKKLPFITEQAINSYDAVYLVADAIKYAKDKYGGDYFTGEKLRQAILDKGKFDNLSTPGIVDPKTQALSRQLAAKVWKEVGGKYVDTTLKVYSSDELNAFLEGEMK